MKKLSILSVAIAIASVIVSAFSTRPALEPTKGRIGNDGEGNPIFIGINPNYHCSEAEGYCLYSENGTPDPDSPGLYVPNSPTE